MCLEIVSDDSDIEYGTRLLKRHHPHSDRH